MPRVNCVPKIHGVLLRVYPVTGAFPPEQLLGSGDIQSLADLSNSLKLFAGCASCLSRPTM